MLLHKNTAQLRIGKHKGAELLGEDIVGANVKTLPTTSLKVIAIRFRHVPKATLREIAHLVVIVKNHSAMAGNTKVF